MIKKLFSKYFLEVVPSIVATVVGAYIVTHYINTKSDADKPKAAVAAPAQTAKEGTSQTLKADEPGDRKAEAARLKAEKLALEKAAAERSFADRAENTKKAAEKLAADKAGAEKLASEKAAAEKRDRERTTAKSAPVAPPAAEANAAPDDKRDANDLARAAIERLRKSNPQSAEQPRTPETARVEESAKREPERAKANSVVYAPAAAPQPSSPQSSAQPLPPAVNVTPPPSEAAVIAPPVPFPAPVQSEARADPSRMTPPADIPSRPMDLRAGQGRTSVTEEVFSAAKSVFHAVIPESSN